MSDFFDFPEPEPEPPRARQPPSKPWVSSPSGLLPGVVALELLLARSELAAVAVTKFAACATGFEFDLVVFVTNDEIDELNPMIIGRARFRGRGRADTRQDGLRFGMKFADGTKVTNQRDWHAGLSEEAPPPDPVMRPRGGSGGNGEWVQSMWIWPLPPPGRLTFVCEWPAAKIELTEVEVDAQLIIDAASRAQQIFERGAE